jgi:Tol biopolymer transport system component
MGGDMLMLRFRAWLLVLALALSGCSVNIGQSQAPAAPGGANGTPALSTRKLPVTWDALNLTGKLVYTAGDPATGTVGIQSLDLETGDVVPIFRTAPAAWLDAAAVSPDHTTLILSYAPPDFQFGYLGSLYRMPLDGSEPPELLVIPPTRDDAYSQPEWSPDGKYIYLAHINYNTMTTYEIMRMAYPDGKPERLVANAYWPRPSQDGARLVYVALDPAGGPNHLFLANADGTDGQQVLVDDLPAPFVIDVPMISPDNRLIIFSSPVGVGASAPHWLDKLLGVTPAFADGSLPSDWWSVPVSGGSATQLTQIASLALYGVFSPDRAYIASFSTDGIFVMKADGSEVTTLVGDVGQISGTVDWIP